jgi:hypothetical protein
MLIDCFLKLPSDAAFKSPASTPHDGEACVDSETVWWGAQQGSLPPREAPVTGV